MSLVAWTCFTVTFTGGGAMHATVAVTLGLKVVGGAVDLKYRRLVQPWRPLVAVTAWLSVSKKSVSRLVGINIELNPPRRVVPCGQ